jgi:GT2 family glycosyltransferase
MEPVVTVLMPVYNAEVYLREAIDSILQQTLTDFEFLIVDDASTDNSVPIIQSYNDPASACCKMKPTAAFRLRSTGALKPPIAN